MDKDALNKSIELYNKFHDEVKQFRQLALDIENTYMLLGSELRQLVSSLQQESNNDGYQKSKENTDGR